MPKLRTEFTNALKNKGSSKRRVSQIAKEHYNKYKLEPYYSDKEYNSIQKNISKFKSTKKIKFGNYERFKTEKDAELQKKYMKSRYPVIRRKNIIYW